MNDTIPSRYEQALSLYYELTENGEGDHCEKVLRDFPDVAGELQEFFDSERLFLDYAGPTAEDAGLQTAMLDTSRIGEVGNTSVAPDTAKSDAADRIEAIPEAFGRYTIESCLGSGAMGAVFLAYDPKLDRQVALKVPRARLEAGSDAWGRFEREAQAAARLRHPNICAVHDVGEHEGLHYIAMAYVDGESLEEQLKGSGPLPIEEAVAITSKLANALASAHAMGIVHRDLKPANVMIDAEGEPIITDFGLAVQFERPETRITQHGTIIGTPAYMAPEQIEGDPDLHGPSVDVYSLGIILYECLTGRVPFCGSITSVVSQAIGRPPEPPSKRRPDITADLDNVCLKMLAKRPDERFQSMDELVAALAPTPQAGLSTSRPSWGLVAALTILCAVGLGIGVVAFGPTKESASKRDASTENKPSAKAKATIERPQLIRRFEGDHKRVWSVAISPDQSIAASGSGREVGWQQAPTDGIFIWNFKTGEVVRHLPFDKANVQDIEFSTNGKRLLVARRQAGKMELFDVESGESLRTFGEGGALGAIFFNEDFVVENEGRTVRVWNVDEGSIVASYPQAEWIASIAVHAATHRLAVGLNPGVVRVLDLHDGQQIHQFTVPALKEKRPGWEQSPKGLAFSPDGSRLLAGIAFTGLCCWKMDSGEKIFESKAAAEAVAWALDGRHVVGGTNGRWGLFDTSGQRGPTVFTLDQRVRDIAISPDGRSLLLGCGPRWKKDDRDFALQHWQLPKSVWPKSVAKRDKAVVPVAWKRSTQDDVPPNTKPKPSPPNHSKQVDQLIVDAKSLIKRRAYRDASEKLREAIRLAPKNAEAHFQRALCSLPFSDGENTHHRTTMRYLDASIRLDRNRADFVGSRAEYLRKLAQQRGNDEKLRRKALADYTTAVQLKSDEYFWWFQKAWLHELFAERDECDRAYRRAAELLQKKKDRNDFELRHLAWSYLNNCLNLVRKGDIEAAIKMGDAAVAVAPKMPNAQLKRALAYERYHDYATALDAAEIAIKESWGKFPDALLLKARILDILGDVSGAQQSAGLALQCGGGPQAATDLAAYNVALGRHDAALYLLAKIRSVAPDDFLAAFGEANARSQAGDFENALKAYADAWKVLEDPLVLDARAHLLRYLDRTEEAEADEKNALRMYSQIIESGDLAIVALERRARLHLRRGHLERSIEDWNRLVKKDPRDVFAVSNLAYLLSAHPSPHHRDGQRALNLSEALTKPPLDKRSFFLSVRAAALAENGQWDEATKWQRRALAVCPLVEYAECAAHLALYEQRKPYRLDGQPENPRETFADVVVPDTIDAASFDALKPRAAKILSAAEIAKQWRSATVLIKSEQGFGTGMIVDRSGFVLTCAHVLPYSGSITIHYDEGDTQRQATAEPIAIDHRHDLALLRFHPPKEVKLQPVYLGIENGVPTKVIAGSNAVVIGNPGEGDWVLQKSVLSGSITSDKQVVGDYVKRSYVQVGVNVAGGCSGGPVFDDHGRVVGVVVRKARTLSNTGFAVPMDRVKQFLGLAGEKKQ